jgi:hypothetical protein
MAKQESRPLFRGRDFSIELCPIDGLHFALRDLGKSLARFAVKGFLTANIAKMIRKDHTKDPTCVALRSDETVTIFCVAQ